MGGRIWFGYGVCRQLFYAIHRLTAILVIFTQFYHLNVMNTVKIIGYPREDFGKEFAKRLRQEAQVPGVLYGGKEQVHFHVPMSLLQPLVYTPKVNFVSLHIGDAVYRCILQDIQIHPVSEILMHVDLLEIAEDKKIKMQVPTVLIGNSPGVAKGGRLVNKIRKLPVSAYPRVMPEQISVDIGGLDIGEMIRVRDIQHADYMVLAPMELPIASVEMTRALKTAEMEEGKK